jgi:hypothetical protein
LADEQRQWTTLTIDEWDGEGPREVDVTTDTAVWSHSGTPPVAIRGGLLRAPQARFTPQAWWSTQPAQTCEQRRAWCVRRWTMAVPWEAARAHRGRETPRQGHERAMARTTPARVRLDSVMTLTAHRRIETGETGGRSPAWSGTTRPTLSEAIAWVRRHWWEPLHWSTSPQETDLMNIPRALLARFTAALG